MPEQLDKFTERARSVLVLAQDEARGLNHNYIGTEHLLLGLVREGEGIAAKVLRGQGVEASAVRQAVIFIIGRGDHLVQGEVGLTPRSKKIMELAVDEARRMGHHLIGTEHLLLGLVREGEGIAARVLEELGLRLERVRAAVRSELVRLTPEEVRARERVEAGVPPGPKNNVVTCRLDDRSLAALDALVEAGIRSTRSDAAAWLIAAGIESHRPLFERVDATIAEIRRLRAEAQQIAQRALAGSADAGARSGEDQGAEPSRADAEREGSGGGARDEASDTPGA